jgi:hypothetical protein
MLPVPLDPGAGGRGRGRPRTRHRAPAAAARARAAPLASSVGGPGGRGTARARSRRRRRPCPARPRPGARGVPPSTRRAPRPAGWLPLGCRGFGAGAAAQADACGTCWPSKGGRALPGTMDAGLRSRPNWTHSPTDPAKSFCGKPASGREPACGPVHGGACGAATCMVGYRSYQSRLIRPGGMAPATNGSGCGP